MKISAELEKENFSILSTIAKDNFDGNLAKSLNFILKTLDEEHFYKVLAQETASRLYLYKEKLDEIRENKKIISERRNAQAAELVM